MNIIASAYGWLRESQPEFTAEESNKIGEKYNFFKNSRVFAFRNHYNSKPFLNSEIDEFLEYCDIKPQVSNENVVVLDMLPSEFYELYEKFSIENGFVIVP